MVKFYTIHNAFKAAKLNPFNISSNHKTVSMSTFLFYSYTFPPFHELITPRK